MTTTSQGTTTSQFSVRDDTGSEMLALELEPPRLLRLTRLVVKDGDTTIRVEGGVLFVEGDEVSLVADGASVLSSEDGLQVTRDAIGIGSSRGRVEIRA